MGTFRNTVDAINFNQSYLNGAPLRDLVNKITNHYQTEHIICFGSVKESKSIKNCFTDDSEQESEHFFLLMITTEVTRIEHQVQDFVNGVFDSASVTILVHGMDTVSHALRQGSRFFNTVCRDGLYLYSARMPDFSTHFIKLKPLTTFTKAEKHYHHRYSMALGFLEAADNCFEKEYFNNTIFMLHQAVEQSCIAMIRVFLSYRSDIHKLSRLLKLCLCFSSEPRALFPTNTTEEQRLFRLLEKSYSDARYRDEYRILRTDAEIVLRQVRSLLELCEQLCTKRIRTYRMLAQADQSVDDWSPALPASMG